MWRSCYVSVSPKFRMVHTNLMPRVVKDAQEYGICFVITGCWGNKDVPLGFCCWGFFLPFFLNRWKQKRLIYSEKVSSVFTIIWRDSFGAEGWLFCYLFPCTWDWKVKRNGQCLRGNRNDQSSVKAHTGCCLLSSSCSAVGWCTDGKYGFPM